MSKVTINAKLNASMTNLFKLYFVRRLRGTKLPFSLGFLRTSIGQDQPLDTKTDTHIGKHDY